MRFPEPPEHLPEDNYARGQMELRYEDLTQVGRIRLTAIPHAGNIPWREKIVHHPLSRIRETGVIPVLSRLVIDGGEGPLPIGPPVDVESCFQLAHSRNEEGEVERIFLNVWAELFGEIGVSFGARPVNAGARVRAGRFYSEYVFTRPFAPPGERKVRRLESQGLTVVPFDRHEWRSLASVVSLPAVSERLDDGWIDEGVPVYFGLDHTDWNQHVNSLVYPGLFQEVALRRLAAHGVGGRLQAVQAEVGYRKPAFPGEALRIVAKAYKYRGGYGVVGWFLPLDAEPPTRPNCYLRMHFEKF